MREGIEFDVRVVKETSEAFLLQFDTDEKQWVPKSQILDDDSLTEGDTGTMTLTEWVAKEKNLV